ncbi:MAG: hypothetical protein R8M11_04280 [Gallionella sp.]
MSITSLVSMVERVESIGQAVKLVHMKSIHLIIPDLFLQKDFVSEVCNGLQIPALERMLACGNVIKTLSSENSKKSMESTLCAAFDMQAPAEVQIGGVSAVFDQLGEGYWLRCDPVHLSLQNDLLLLQQVKPSQDEALGICKSMNEHFLGDGMEFFAPHPKRWYVRSELSRRIHTTPLPKVIGTNVHGVMPEGEDATRWHSLLNEMQMLLYSHPVNEAREARGELPVNSVWLWGGGDSGNTLPMNYDHVISDDELPEMFASVSGASFAEWPKHWDDMSRSGRTLMVWTGLRTAIQSGDLQAWRSALQDFESNIAQPLFDALRAGEIKSLQINITDDKNALSKILSRRASRAFWRRAKPLASYSIV